MDTVDSAVVVLDATDVLTTRWTVSERAATDALSEAARELGVNVLDLAAMVSAAARRTP